VSRVVCNDHVDRIIVIIAQRKGGGGVQRLATLPNVAPMTAAIIDPVCFSL
jgi:hypothetical protein